MHYANSRNSANAFSTHSGTIINAFPEWQSFYCKPVVMGLIAVIDLAQPSSERARNHVSFANRSAVPDGTLSYRA